MIHRPALPPLFFFNDTATTEIYTLSLHDALPISTREQAGEGEILKDSLAVEGHGDGSVRIPRRSSGTSRVCSNWRSSMSDRKSTRLNSSHLVISYAVFCLKKKKKRNICATNASST